ncbi:hypothetical protein JXA32_06915 [Candidatus Sumerlaeota bacterium]|nr:hypothetical protein [Candidatus Sumerlaeota bacterium]
MLRITCAILLLYIAVALTGCAAQQATRLTHDRLRECFQLPEDEPVTPEAIKDVLRKDLAVGVTDSYIRAYLKARGIGDQPNELIYPDRRSNGLYCKIMYPPGSIGWSKPIYLIFFQLDENKRLVDLDVQLQHKTPEKHPEMLSR